MDSRTILMDRHSNPLFLCKLDRLLVTCVDMAQHSHAGIRGQYAFEALGSEVRAVGHHHHAGVMGIANAYAASVVDAHPGCSCGSVDECVQQGPVGYGVGAVEHAFGLAVGRCYGAGVEVVAADDDWGADLAASYQLVHGDAELRALPVPQPADARRKSLEVDTLLRQFDPATETCVFGEEFEYEVVGAVDVLWVARKRHPAEWAFALAEERADVFGHEAWDFVRVLDSDKLRLRTDVVAVVEGDCAHTLEFQHSLDVVAHSAHREARVLFRVALAEIDRFGQVHAVRHVAVQRVVGAGLVSQNIGDDVAADEFRQHVSGVGYESDGDGFVVALCSVEDGECFVERPCDVVAVAAGEALLDAGGINVDAEEAGAVHGGGEGLGSAHSAHSSGDNELAFEAAEVAASGFGKGLVGSLDDALAADVNPGAGGHLAVHHQALALQLVEVLPVGPLADEVGVGEQDARRGFVRAQDADRFAGLDEQGLVVLEALKGADDGVEALPVASCLAGSAVDDEVVGALGHFRVEVVHQHAQSGFLLPALGVQACAARGADDFGCRFQHVALLQSPHLFEMWGTQC